MTRRVYGWWADRWCPVALACRLIGRVGWQAALVTALAPIWIVYGIAVLTGRSAGLGCAPHLILPVWLRGVAWIASGAAALASLQAPRARPWVVAALWVMPVIRTVSYAAILVGALLPDWLVPDVFPGEGPLDPLGAAYGLARHAALLLLVLVATLLPHDPRPIVTRRSNG